MPARQISGTSEQSVRAPESSFFTRSVSTDLASSTQSRNGRDYVILYLLTKWGKLAAGGYWLNPKKIFEKAYVTDATLADLVLVAERLEDLPEAHLLLDDVFNRGGGGGRYGSVGEARWNELRQGIQPATFADEKHNDQI